MNNLEIMNINDHGVKFKNGLTLNWGYGQFKANGTTVTFNTPFLQRPYMLLGNRSGGSSYYAIGVSIDEWLPTSFTAHGWQVNGISQRDCFWLAIGF